MESRSKKMIIIGALIFLAVVVATLSITLPIVLRSDDEQSNNSTNNSNMTTMEVSHHESTAATTANSDADRSSTDVPPRMKNIALQDTLPTLQSETIKLVVNKTRGLFKLSSNPADRAHGNQNHRKNHS